MGTAPSGQGSGAPNLCCFHSQACGRLLQAAQQQEGPRCSKTKRTQEKDLHLSHPLLHPCPCCILPAWECWQHVLAAGRGCALVLLDSKVPLLCSATGVVPKRCIFNISEELSLDGLSCKPSSCGIKSRKGSGKKDNKFFICGLLCVAAVCVSHVWHTEGREQRVEEPLHDLLP